MCLVCAVVPRICLGSWKDPGGMDDVYIGRRKMSLELRVPFKALYDTAIYAAHATSALGFHGLGLCKA